MESLFDVILANEKSPQLKDEKSREFDSDSTLSQCGSDRSIPSQFTSRLNSLTDKDFASQLESILQIPERNQHDDSDSEVDYDKENQDSSILVPESPDLSVCIESPLKRSVSDREWSESPIQKVSLLSTDSILMAKVESNYEKRTRIPVLNRSPMSQYNEESFYSFQSSPATKLTVLFLNKKSFSTESLKNFTFYSPMKLDSPAVTAPNFVSSSPRKLSPLIPILESSQETDAQAKKEPLSSADNETPYRELINKRLGKIRPSVVLYDSPASHQLDDTPAKLEVNSDEIITEEETNNSLSCFISNLKTTFNLIKSDSDFTDNTVDEKVYIGICKLLEDYKTELEKEERSLDSI